MFRFMRFLGCFERRKYDFQRCFSFFADLAMRDPHFVKTSELLLMDCKFIGLAWKSPPLSFTTVVNGLSRPGGLSQSDTNLNS